MTTTKVRSTINPLVLSKKMAKVLEALADFKEEEALTLLWEELPGLSRNIDSLREFLGNFFLNTVDHRIIFFFNAAIRLLRVREEEEDEVRKAISTRIEEDERIGLTLGFTPEILRVLRYSVSEKTFNLEEVREWRQKLVALKKKLAI